MMTVTTPYAYYQCPCSSQSASSDDDTASQSDDAPRDDERTFDPRAPRSNFSLYPLEYLMYCEDCNEIRCPRCVSEEIVTFFCPSCLMEVPSSMQRTEGNRCTRSCYQCPICVAPVSVTQLPSKSTGATLDPENATAQPAFALVCGHCNWTSSEVNIELDRPSGIHNQLSKIKTGGGHRITAKDVKERRKTDPDLPRFPDDQVDAEMQFAMLKSFYQTQLPDSKSNIEGGPGGYSSPAAITRIMSMYTAGPGRGIDRRNQGPPDVMRESLHTEEGLRLEKLDESTEIEALMAHGWDGTLNKEQRLLQAGSVHFHDEVRPVPTLLRTKRSKRCPMCRHIITKPENKVTSTRFKIRLVAKSYIPSITIKPLNPTAKSVPVLSRPMHVPEEPLKPLTMYQYVVTFKNPLFENVKITLAAPNKTPGRFASTVTVLCPTFEIDANIDMWDAALQDDEKDPKRKNEESNGQVVTGKIWERGRNWVSIIVEVVPPSLRTEHLGLTAKDGETVDKSPLREGEDMLEIPMFVRMEWEAQAEEDVGAAPGKDKEAKEKRELAYWCVLGVGQISRD